MEFRKMVTITLYTRQQKRHWCIEQSLGLCGRGRGWDDLGEWHWNMYNVTYEASRQSRLDARYWTLEAGALGRPRGMVWGGRREAGSAWGTRVYLWQIHVDIWENQYNIVNLKNKNKNIKKFYLRTERQERKKWYHSDHNWGTKLLYQGLEGYKGTRWAFRVKRRLQATAEYMLRWIQDGK